MEEDNVSILVSAVSESGFPDQSPNAGDPVEVPPGRRFRIDPARSRIGFAVKHFKVVTVRGRFTDYSGEVILAKARGSRVSSAIDRWRDRWILARRCFSPITR